MKYLTQVVETYRVDNEADVIKMIEEADLDKYPFNKIIGNIL